MRRYVNGRSFALVFPLSLTLLRALLFGLGVVLFWMTLSPARAELVRFREMGYDRHVYVGVSGVFIPMVDKARHSTSPMWGVEGYWGSDWSRLLSFDVNVYNYRFREDKEQRPTKYRYAQAESAYSYQHFGVRLRGLFYLFERRAERLRPLLDFSYHFLPYVVLGASFEPTVTRYDYSYPEGYGNRYFGFGLHEGLGFLQVFRNSNFRLRYEGIMNHSFHPSGEQSRFGAFNELVARFGVEYSFALLEVIPTTKVSVLSGGELRDPFALRRLEQGENDSFANQLGGATHNLHSVQSVGVLFPVEGTTHDGGELYSSQPLLSCLPTHIN